MLAGATTVTAGAAALVGAVDLAGGRQLAQGPGCAIELLAACPC